MLLVLILALGVSACAGQKAAGTPVNPAGSGTITPTPDSGANASGFVVADQEARMAFKLAGNVTSVQVRTGEAVRAGQLLVQLDDASQQVALEQAALALQALTSPAALAAAQATVAQDQKDLTTAQSNLNNQVYYSTNADAIQNARANLTMADKTLSNARTAYNNTPGDPDKDLRKAYAYQKLYTAQQAYDAALYNYNWWTGSPNQYEIDLKTAAVAGAKARLSEDQVLVSVLQGAPIPEGATGAGMVQLRQAHLAVDQAQAALDATRLVAPFDGEVGTVSISVGDYISPGQTILVVSDTQDLHVETTDLSERDIPTVKIGQEATLTVKALHQDVKGTVTAISPVSGTLGGDVVYQVNLALSAVPSGLRPGMSVDVQFEPDR